MSPTTRQLSTASSTKSFNVSQEVVIAAVAVLLFVMVFVIVLHVYVHCYIIRVRRQDQARSRRTRLVFRVDQPAGESESRGLDTEVLKSLPVFKHCAGSHVLECAVCLSEVEEGESGRTLPKCHHSFHMECIDMWFSSHSTCPLCRATVESPETPRQGNGLGSESASTSSGSSGKPARDLSISITVPGRTLNPGDVESPAQMRSPVGRIMSMILSRDIRPSTPTPSPAGGCSVSVAEGDLECGWNK